SAAPALPAAARRRRCPPGSTLAVRPRPETWSRGGLLAVRRLRDVGEHAWIAALARRLAARPADRRILVGPGDDAAAVRPGRRPLPHPPAPKPGLGAASALRGAPGTWASTHGSPRSRAAWPLGRPTAASWSARATTPRPSVRDGAPSSSPPTRWSRTSTSAPAGQRRP